DRLAILIDQFFIEGMAEPLGRRALVLSFRRETVENMADIGNADIVPDLDLARILVDLDAAHPGRRFPEQRCFSERAAARFRRDAANADDLAAVDAIGGMQHLLEGPATAARR